MFYLWVNLCFIGLALSLIMLYILYMSITYNPNKRKRAKTHGFLARTKTPGGKKVNARRRAKGRANVSISK